jgi:hypothetical protein
MPSFDIISEIDHVELNNAVDNAKRELTTRFDFRGVQASYELNKETVKMISSRLIFELARGVIISISPFSSDKLFSCSRTLRFTSARKFFIAFASEGVPLVIIGPMCLIIIFM